MKTLFVIVCIISCFILLSFGIKYLYSKDKATKYTFIKTKGLLYAVLALLSFVIEFCIDGNCSPIILLTICIAGFEATHILIELKVEKYDEYAKKYIEKYTKTNDSNLKKIEKVFIYCTEKLEPLKKKEVPIDSKQLAYEQIHDYLKYYYSANAFFEKFNAYMDNKCTIEDVDQALCEWKEFFEMYGTDIIKLPE